MNKKINSIQMETFYNIETANLLIFFTDVRKRDIST